MQVAEMKDRVAIGASLAFAMAVSSQAGAAGATITLEPVALGAVDAVAQFCSNRNPSGTATYSKLTASVFGTQPASALQQLRLTAQYKSAFREYHGRLFYAPRDLAHSYCVSLVPTGSKG
jgi:hypothetical protein